MKKIVVAALAFALMAGPAYAAEWNFYGEAKIYTGWNDKDLIDADDNGDQYDVQYGEGIYASSVIGADVKVSDELSGRFEYGTDGGNANIRHLYGVWNFGSGTLLVGQSDTPLNVTYSNQFANDLDLGLGGFGDLDNDRNPELMLTFGGFSVAFIATETDDFGLYDTQAVIPMIAACYKAAFDMGEVQIAGGYNTFEVNDDEDIDSYSIGLGGQLNFGAFGVFATGVWGQNIAYLGAGDGTDWGGVADYNGSEIDDCESIGGTIGLTFTVNDMLTLETGYGYIHDESDDYDETSIAQSYYLQAAITLAPGVTVTPEVGMIDQREAGSTEDMYFGAVWAIAF